MATTGQSPDGEGRDDDGRPSAPPAAAPAGVNVPDDASDLDLDVIAYRREQQARRRQERLRRLLPGVLQEVPTTFILVVVAMAVVVVTVGLLLQATIPHTSTPTQQAGPIAAPTVPVGAIGGLLPDTYLTSARTEINARTLRPALLVLVPAACDCLSRLDDLASQAAEFQIAFAVVRSGPPDETLAALVSHIRKGPATAYNEPSRHLALAYHPTGVSLVLVRADGTVAEVDRSIPAGHHWEAALLQLTT